jgi:hypothetical protein
VVFSCREELQLKQDILGTLDTPEHTATLLSMLRLAQQLAVAEAVQQQLLQANTAADKEPLAGQPTIAALQPPALVLLRIMRMSALTAAKAAAGQQQQQHVPAEMLQQLLVLRMEQLHQQQARHFMWGPATCIQVSSSSSSSSRNNRGDP